MSYNEYVFDDNEQIRLSEFVSKISQKGAKVLLSNSDSKNTNEQDDFFDEIYKKMYIKRIDAKRVVNSKVENRGSIKELLITNMVM